MPHRWASSSLGRTRTGRDAASLGLLVTRPHQDGPRCRIAGPPRHSPAPGRAAMPHRWTSSSLGRTRTGRDAASLGLLVTRPHQEGPRCHIAGPPRHSGAPGGAAMPHRWASSSLARTRTARDAASLGLFVTRAHRDGPRCRIAGPPRHSGAPGRARPQRNASEHASRRDRAGIGEETQPPQLGALNRAKTPLMSCMRASPGPQGTISKAECMPAMGMRGNRFLRMRMSTSGSPKRARPRPEQLR